MPGDIFKYRTVRRGREVMVTATKDTADNCKGVFHPMPYDRPILEKVGSSMERGGHDCDVDEMGERIPFDIKVTRTAGKVTGYTLSFDYPVIEEALDPSGLTTIETLDRTVIAVA